MSSAPSLYRRRRPRSFADLIGQETVVRTLRHAVERGKVHHAYLFVGSRGTGKTSMAKILAACLNCERGPTTEPCGECDSCRSIASATSLDVMEMDAASNNSVDDIRELRESVAYAPVSGRHKVYILDEAHMLSSAAWNAFLKTLEEPPPNTIFVLATTEAQKVPATVVDRCHRFDFQRPTVEQIAGVVRRAAEAESIEIPPAAAAAIARSATGSFRDALGTLEQLVTYSGQRIALEDVLAVLGVADAELLEETFDAVAGADPRRALLALQRCVESGRDAASFASDLEVRARELLVVQTLDSVPAELSVTPEADAALAAQAARVSRGVVVRMLELLAAALEAVRAGADPRTQLELALVKASVPQIDGSTRALMARVERLEAALAAHAGAGAAPAVARAPATAPGPRAPSPAPAHAAATAPGPPPSPASAHAASVQTDPGVGGSERYPPPPEPAATPPSDDRSAAERQPPTERTAVPSAPGRSLTPVAVADAAGARAGAWPPTAAPDALPVSPLAPAAAGGPAQEASPARTAATAAQEGDLATVQSLWPAVLDTVRGENTLLAALIADARPVALVEGELTVAFAPSAAFLKKKAEDHANKVTVSEALQKVTGRRLRPRYELREDAVPEAVAPTEEEWVRRFMAEFDAEELTEPQPEGE